jgi:hypothetical protein
METLGTQIHKTLRWMEVKLILVTNRDEEWVRICRCRNNIQLWLRTELIYQYCPSSGDSIWSRSIILLIPSLGLNEISSSFTHCRAFLVRRHRFCLQCWKIPVDSIKFTVRILILWYSVFREALYDLDLHECCERLGIKICPPLSPLFLLFIQHKDHYINSWSHYGSGIWCPIALHALRNPCILSIYWAGPEKLNRNLMSLWGFGPVSGILLGIKVPWDILGTSVFDAFCFKVVSGLDVG